MAPKAQSPEWWRDRLLTRFKDDYQLRRVYQNLYESTQPSLEMLPGYSEAYKRLLKMARTPWPRLVVDIVAERLDAIGIHSSKEGTPDDTLWDMLGASRMDMIQSQVYSEAIAFGTSYVSIWPSDSLPKMAWESGLMMTHEIEPGDPTKVAAALKVWYDAIKNQIRVNLYLPEGVYKWSAASSLPATHRGEQPAMDTMVGTLPTDESKFKQLETPLENPYDRVPVVPFVIRPSWEGYGRSDLDDLIPIFARLENLTANIMLAVELGAFRQRWATGLEVPVDPETEEPVEPFKVALDRLWISGDDKTKFGSFEATDITAYLKAVSDAVGQLSAVSRIPVTYFVQSELANPPSAASFEASETGLIHKIHERQETLAVGWDSLIELAIQMADMPASPADAPFRIQWRDARTRSEAQVLDAAVKLNAVGAPWEAVMEFIGYEPQEIAAMKRARAADTFNRLLNTPVPQAPQLAPPAEQEQPQPSGQ